MDSIQKQTLFPIGTHAHSRAVIPAFATGPHAQAAELGAEPSVMAQTGPLRHLFTDA